MPWQYLIVLQEDLLTLGWMLSVMTVGMALPAIVIALTAAARVSRWDAPAWAACVLLAWLVGTFVWTVTYLLGWGLATRLFQYSQLSVSAIPFVFYQALTCVSFGIAVVLSYRHSATWLEACKQSSKTEDGAHRVPRSPLRASFSLGTLLLYQLILLLGMH